jgi:hypothetical protein
MNLAYFHEFPDNILKQARYNLQTNYVNSFLKRQGYQVIVFDSGTGDTNNQYADRFLSVVENEPEDRPGLNAFEQLLVRTTLGLGLMSGDADAEGGAAGNRIVDVVNQELDLRRSRITFALTHLPDYAAQEGPQFVFAHVYSPHIPFLYGPDGAELTYQAGMNFYWYEPPPENYIEYYTYQIDYLNRAVLESIDAILSRSHGPVVIILQGDHGDDHYVDWIAPDARGVNARTAILNAIYFSDGNYTELYPSITPVNTYRAVFNHWFGTRFAFLEDKVYAHPHPLKTPPGAIPKFLEGCAEFGICQPAR